MADSFQINSKQHPNTFLLLSISCRPCLVLSKLCYVVDYDFPRIWHSVDVAHQGLAKKQNWNNWSLIIVLPTSVCEEKSSRIQQQWADAQQQKPVCVFLKGFFYTIKVVSRCNGPFQILFQHVQLIVSPLTMDKPVLNPRAIFLKGNNHLYIQVCENKSIVIWSKLVWYTYIRGTHNTHWPYRINRSFFSLVSLDGKPTKKLDFERLISIGSLIARHLAWNWAIEIDRKVLIDPTIITLVVWRLLFPPLFIRLTTLQFKCFI